MTVANQSIRADATGAGLTGPFTFAFCVFNIANLKVILTDTTGINTNQILTTDYTVVGTKAPTDYTQGGVVTFNTAVPAGYHVTLLSNEPGTQGTSIKNNTAYYAVLHENEFDTLAIFDLQMLEKMNKAIVAPDSEPAGTATLTLASIIIRASTLLGFDALGNIQYFVPGQLILDGITAFNTFLGQGAGAAITTGQGNTGIGQSALAAATSGSSNTGVGRFSLASLISGASNVALGVFSLRLTTTGVQNTAVGQSALQLNVTGSRNIGLGSTAGKNQTGDDTFIVDNVARADAATEMTDSILAGKMDLTRTNQYLRVNGALIPFACTTTERGAITPAEGMIVFDTSLHHPFYYNGSAWVQI